MKGITSNMAIAVIIDGLTDPKIEYSWKREDRISARGIAIGC